MGQPRWPPGQQPGEASEGKSQSMSDGSVKEAKSVVLSQGQPEAEDEREDLSHTGTDGALKNRGKHETRGSRFFTSHRAGMPM